MPACAGIAQPGNVVTAAPRVNGTEFRTQSGGVCWVEFFSRDIVRIRFAPSGRIGQIPVPSISGTFPLISAATIFRDTEVSIEAPGGKVVIDRAPFRIRVLRPDGSTVIEEKLLGTTWDIDTGLISTQCILPAGESWHGGGFRGGPVNRRSRAFQFRNTAQAGYGDLTDPLNISIPFFLTLRDGKAGGLLLNNPATPFVDIAASMPDTVLFGAFEGELDYFVFLGPTPQSVLADYHQVTGAPALPPLWSLGFHQSRYGYRTQDEVLEIAAQFRQREIPCDAIHLDLDYMQDNNLFSWDPERFPNPAAMNAQLGAQGIRTTVILQSGVRVKDPAYGQLAQNGSFLKQQNGTPYVSGSFVGELSWLDFGNPGLRQWYGAGLQNFLTSGPSGLWIDLNEPDDAFIPADVMHLRGNRKLKHSMARNLYAFDQAEHANQTLMSSRPDDRPWVLSRAGWSGIHRYAANWSGDTASTWDALRTCIHTTISMGISGQNQFGHDIGGFLDTPSPELFLRWLQFAAYTPLFRTHSTNTTAQREPWRFEEPFQTPLIQAIREHYRLLPFWYSLFERANRLSEPVLAPLLFHFPGDTQTTETSEEYLLGGMILIAPVFEAGATAKDIYLPAGTDWFDFYTGQKYNGGTRASIPVQLDRIPVLVRDGAAIPYASAIAHTGLLNTADIEWRLYGSADLDWTYYEDDGRSQGYRNNAFVRASVKRSNGGQTLTISRAAGVLDFVERSRTITLYGRDAAPNSVLLNGTVVPKDTGWKYSADNKTLTVQLSRGAAEFTLEIA